MNDSPLLTLVPLALLAAALSGCQDAGEVIVLADDDHDGFIAFDDCNDQDANVSPAAVEQCNGLDDDCDGIVDNDGLQTLFEDSDGDGFGTDAQPTTGCPTDGWVAIGGDCDDTRPAVHPDAPELCNDIDDDCDGKVDREAENLPIWYADFDHDAYGSTENPYHGCDAPAGYVPTSGDCDDTLPSVRPTASEICDGVDNDCDGDIDNGASLESRTFFGDEDGDGHGDPGMPVAACAAPPDFAESDDDCDDLDGEAFPGQIEVCNGKDDDCDGTTDGDDATDAAWIFKDADRDGHGSPLVTAKTCAAEAPTGWSDSYDDCDDSDPTITTPRLWYSDADDDGYGVRWSPVTACTAPAGRVSNDTDCDDTAPMRHPGATEQCRSSLGNVDGVDDDCDSTADEGCPATECEPITTNTTWAAGSTHFVVCTLMVAGGATLTIQDGALVQFAPGVGLQVGGSGSGTVDIKGTTAGVTFTSAAADAAPGDWAGVTVYANGTFKASKLTLEYAGTDYADSAAIQVYGTATVQRSTVRYSSSHAILAQGGIANVSDTQLVDNAGYGFACTMEPCFRTGSTAFARNTVTGNSAPVLVYPDDVPFLASSSTYAGNDEDDIDLQSGTVTTTAIWNRLDARYRARIVTIGDTSKQPTLTLSPGVTIAFEEGGALNVGTSTRGNLIVAASLNPILLTSAIPSPRPGDWLGVTIGSQATSVTDISGLSVEYAGQSSQTALRVNSTGPIAFRHLDLRDNAAGGFSASSAQVSVADSMVADNGGDGVSVDFWSSLTDAFAGNTLTGNGGYPLLIPATALGLVSPSSTYAGNGIDAVRIPNSATITTDQTWSAIDVPYAFDGFITIGHNANAPTVTIEDGVEALWDDSGSGLYVGTAATGDLVIDGDRVGGHGVRFTGVREGFPGGWLGVTFGSGASARSRITGWILDGGGAFSSNPAGLTVNNVNGLAIDDCEIRNSKYAGIYLYGSEVALRDTTVRDTVSLGREGYNPDGDGLFLVSNSSFTAFARNTFTGNDRYPVYLHPSQMASLDAASQYTGNGSDRVAVDSGTISTGGTWQTLDVPWYLGMVHIGCTSCASPAEITVNDATIEFAYNGTIRVGEGGTGDLRATGCEFTSARGTPTAGDWLGLYFGSGTSARSLVTTSAIRYGGRGTDASTSGNIYLLGARGTYTSNQITDSYQTGLIQISSNLAVVSENTYARNLTSTYFSP